MAHVGYCCNYASDCNSGICIGKVCRQSLDPIEVKEDHADKIIWLVCLLAIFLLIGILVSLCIMFRCNCGESELDLEISTKDDDPYLRRRSSIRRIRQNSGVKITMHLETGSKSPLPNRGTGAEDFELLSDGNVITQ